MVEEEALGNGPEDEVEKKNQEREGERGRERERESVCVCVLGRPKYDKTTLLHQNTKGEKRGCFYVQAK